MTDIDTMVDDNLRVSKAVHEYCMAFDDKPVEWGVDDCTMFPVAWVAQVRTGRAGKPVELDVPYYDSQERAHELIEEYGDLTTLWGEVASINRVEPVHFRGGEPIWAGDVGVVRMRDFDAGCIFTSYGRFAMMRTPNGAHAIGPRLKHILGVWRP